MSRDITPFGLRMPPELKHRIEEDAKASGRSMNAQIVYMLNRYLYLNVVDDLRQRELEREDAVARARPEDLEVGDRIMKEFQEHQAAMLHSLLVKHGVIPRTSDRPARSREPKAKRPEVERKPLGDKARNG
ncbi:Arc family DNA-binding protein [Achromobacter xylosoxidans]|uniref:Arc family DNA-binding protein n=1 Tax=Alcaligenes xylosoxydans xylosoxydans TaxID=85698 RepID=UPI003EE1FCEF